MRMRKGSEERRKEEWVQVLGHDRLRTSAREFAHDLDGNLQGRSLLFRHSASEGLERILRVPASEQRRDELLDLQRARAGEQRSDA